MRVIGIDISRTVAEVVARDLQAVRKVRGEVDFVADGDRPNDGKVIDDPRTYE